MDFRGSNSSQAASLKFSIGATIIVMKTGVEAQVFFANLTLPVFA